MRSPSLFAGATLAVLWPCMAGLLYVCTVRNYVVFRTNCACKFTGRGPVKGTLGLEWSPVRACGCLAAWRPQSTGSGALTSSSIQFWTSSQQSSSADWTESMIECWREVVHVHNVNFNWCVFGSAGTLSSSFSKRDTNRRGKDQSCWSKTCCEPCGKTNGQRQLNNQLFLVAPQADNCKD